ncbi:MAG: arylamine N-acetyltransferase [Firmicutes bacterium]|nr:arylamine N-acetyltransferase [Bacillota bacterium]
MYEDFYQNIKDKDAFLRRIDLDPSEIGPDLESLKKITYAHHRHVPFDNLDVWAEAKEPSLSIPDLFDKIVERRRGGYCFEMNGLLEAALRTIGFSCYSVGIRITKGRDFIPPVRHRGVITIIDGVKYFCDVGLGFIFFPDPAEFNGGYVRSGYKAVCEDGLGRVFVKKEDGEEEILRFDDRPALPIDFINPNFVCSQDPGSGFRTRLSMVIMTPEEERKNLVSDGPFAKAETSVITLKDPSGRLISQRTIDNKTELSAALLEEFGVEYKVE